MEREMKPKREWVFLALILAAAVALRFFRLGAQSFWTDELLSIQLSEAPAGISYWRKVLWDVHGPLYSVILHFAKSISSQEAVLRTPSALAGVLSVFFMYRWLVVIGRRDLALLGALLIAVNPFNIYYSQELRFYSLVGLFSIVSLIAFERFLADPSYRRGALLGVMLAVTCLSHFSALFLCAGFFLYLVLTRRLKGQVLRSAALAAAVLLVIISPWIYREIYFLRTVSIVNVPALPVEERLRGAHTINIWSYPYTLYAFSAGYSLGPDLRELHEVRSGTALLGRYGLQLIVTMVLFGGVLAAGIAKSLRGKRGVFFIIIAAVPLLGTTLLAVSNVKVFNVRYLTCMFPVYVALLAFGVPDRRLFRGVVTAALCAVMLVSAWNYFTVPRYGRDDLKGAARIITELEEPGDLVLVLTVRATFDYYYRGPNDTMTLYPRVMGRTRTEERLDGIFAKHDRIWYLRCRPWDADPDDLLLALLRKHADETHIRDLPGIEIYLFDKPAD
jgi:uncharacterized membrane protein